MTREEELSFYLPYKIKGQYRLGDVVENAPNPDEIREKILHQKVLIFSLDTASLY